MSTEKDFDLSILLSEAEGASWTESGRREDELMYSSIARNLIERAYLQGKINGAQRTMDALKPSIDRVNQIAMRLYGEQDSTQD